MDADGPSPAFPSSPSSGGKWAPTGTAGSGEEKVRGGKSKDGKCYGGGIGENKRAD